MKTGSRTLQEQADELMDIFETKDIWRLSDGQWFTDKDRADKCNQTNGKTRHFTKQ